jgi:hypothetical protein
VQSISTHRIALKSPLTTPVGDGFSSINVELRKRFDLYANVRPAISFPNTRARYSDIDIITVRENTEGAYIGEGQNISADGNTATLQQRVTRKGSERIVRYAFDMARKIGRRKVTVVHKANILKSTSGLFLKVAREVAQQYPDIACNEMIVDNTCMQLVMKPEQFDVIVTTNLFGHSFRPVRGPGRWPRPRARCEHRCGCGDLRSRPRFRARHRRQGPGQSLRAAARHRADARSPRLARGCRTPAQGDPRDSRSQGLAYSRPRRQRRYDGICAGDRCTRPDRWLKLQCEVSASR